MTLNGAIMQLVELRENSMMPVCFKPYLDKVIETISECEEPSAQPQACDDAISREDAKWVVFCNRDHVEDQTNAIDSLPCVQPSAQPEQRWIPCEERLPEKSGLYIVTNTIKIQPVSTRWFNKMRNDAESFWSGHPNDKVLAWMPIALPEPWKEGEAE